MQQINLSPITQFIHQVRAAELGQQKEVKLTIQQARLVSLALAEIMDKMNRDYETMFNSLKQTVVSESVTVMMDGGGFNDTK